MNFKFNVTIDDRDYLDYNMFWMMKSPYGKKEITKFRIFFAVAIGAICVLSLIVGEFSAEAFLGIIPYVILLALLQAFLNSLFVMSLKSNIKSLKKKGKMGFSPVSEMEFSDDSFIEITPENKTEQKYSAIERVSVITDKVIYIHVNNIMSYILPITCFESKEQLEKFLDFIKTKCANIDIYR